MTQNYPLPLLSARCDSHDLLVAPMFMDHAFLLAQGCLVTAGCPAEVLREEFISTVFGCRLRVDNRRPESVCISLFVQP